MKKCHLFFPVLITFICLNFNNIYSQTTIAYWNFDNFTKSITLGSGTLTTIGGITEDWTKTGVASGISVPSGLLETEFNKSGGGMQTINYPAQSTNPKTAGIQLNVSTIGYKNILFSVDVRQGGSSANKMMLQYTVDGITWEKAITYTTSDDDTWYLRNYNFSTNPAVNNNSKFAIRLVTNYDDDVLTASVYVPVKSTVLYAASGPVRFDNVKVRGTSIENADDNRSIITSWNFNYQNLNSDTGNGSIEVIGGVTYDWLKTGILPNQTILNEGVYDFAAIKDSLALNTLNYPSITSANKTAGIELNFNTLNFRNIKVSCDVRHGGSSANNMAIQYSTDETNWIDAKEFIVNSGDTWFKKEFDFSEITAVNNIQKLKIRYVTSFNGTGYVATKSDKIYATTSPIRFDNLVITGNNTSDIHNHLVNPVWKIIDNKIIFQNYFENNIRIYNLSGNLISDFKSAQEIDISNLPKGFYFLVTDSINSKFLKF